jgi:hypothetical protein
MSPHDFATNCRRMVGIGLEVPSIARSTVTTAATSSNSELSADPACVDLRGRGCEHVQYRQTLSRVRHDSVATRAHDITKADATRK